MLSRQALLACPASSSQNLPFFSLWTPPSDPPLSRQDAALAHLTIWCSGLTALFLFLLARAAPTFLPTAFSVALRPLFPFQQTQYVQVFPLKPAPFCTLLAGLGSTKFAISLLFSYYLTFLFPLISYSVTDMAGTVFSLLLFYQTTMGIRTLVSPRKRCG